MTTLTINHFIGLIPKDKYRVYLDGVKVNEFETKSEANAYCDRLIRKKKIKRIYINES